jgi:hypothetical protein
MKITIKSFASKNRVLPDLERSSALGLSQQPKLFDLEEIASISGCNIS